jgi:hypothetical protein
MYNSSRKDMGLMDMQSFRTAVDLSADYLKEKRFPVVLQHRGESLLHPGFFEMLRYAGDKGLNIGGIHTNFNVSVDMERLVESPLPSILVNMGGITRDIHEKVMRGSSYDLVVENLKSILRKIRVQRSDKKVFLKINPTKENFFQLGDAPAYFESLGGDPSNFQIGRTAFFLPHEASREEIEDYFSNIVSKAVEPYLTFTYDRDLHIFPKFGGCTMIMPAVLWDGRVTICCQDQLGILNLGNAFRTSLGEILQSRMGRLTESRGRERKLPICRYCN